MRRVASALTAIGLIFCVAPAYAQSIDGGDTAWVLTATALVLCMTVPGLALFYAGMVRSDNVVSVLMQCFAIAAVVSVAWLVIGYSLAFGDSVGLLIGNLGKVLFAGVQESSAWGTIPESVFAIFQLTFAIITPALIVGAFVERFRFSAVLLFTLAWSLLVYAPITHSVWGGGWLGALGLMDFAGGTVVHVTAGAAALVAARMVGPRAGFPDRTQPAHNIPLIMVGAGLLWVGWLGFNGGSALAANGDAAMAIVVTHFSAAIAACTWMLAEWRRNGKPTAVGFACGMVAGLATSTGASGFVGPAAALVLGIGGGWLCFHAVSFVKQTLNIDDSLDVFAVHFVGGALGTLLVGIFASDSLGIFSGQEAINILSSLIVQAIGVAATAGYTFMATWIILKAANRLIPLRVSEDEERRGLDRVGHGEVGYSYRGTES